MKAKLLQFGLAPNPQSIALFECGGGGACENLRRWSRKSRAIKKVAVCEWVRLSLSLARCAAHSAAIKKVFSGACSENLASGEQSLIRQFGVSTHLVTDIFEDARAPLSPLYSALCARAILSSAFTASGRSPCLSTLSPLATPWIRDARPIMKLRHDTALCSTFALITLWAESAEHLDAKAES
jgi:hypothetical protein